MFNRFKKKLRKCLGQSELEKMNILLIRKNSQLVSTIEELRLENSEIKQYYFDLLSVNNELLAKLNKYQSASSLNLNKFHQAIDTEDSLAAEEINNNSVD